VRAAVAIACAALLWGCGNERSAEGPGSETSGLSARLLLPDGAPAAGVWVRVHDLAGWTARMRAGSSTILDSQRTDAQGVVRFRPLASARVVLEAATSAGRARLETGMSDSVQALRLDPGGSLRISIDGSPLPVRWLALLGGDKAAPVAGGWDFGTLPSGWYDVVAATDSGIVLAGRVRADSGRAVDTVLSIPDGSVLLDDYVRPSVKNRWGDLLGEGWWYSTVDSGEGGTARVSPDGAVAAWTSAGCPDGAPGCLHFAFSMDTTLPVHYALVGQDLDASRLGPDSTLGWIDLSKTDSVVIVVRGSGAFEVQIPSRDARGRGFRFYASLRIPSGWSRVAIPVDAFLPDTANGLSWKDADWKATGLLLLTESPADLWIGSIVLVGPSARDLFAELRAQPGDFP